MKEGELFVSFLIPTGGTTGINHGELECVRLPSLNYFPRKSLLFMFTFRADHTEIIVGDKESFSHFIALTPCCQFADLLHWCKGCESATAQFSPGFSFNV